MLTVSRFMATAIGSGLFAVASPIALAQEKVSQSILTIERQGAGETNQSGKREPAISLISSSVKAIKTNHQQIDVHDGELVRDRYPSGKVHVERTVVLDKDGNFVNHGEYREFAENGDLLVSGSFRHGVREGVWVRFLKNLDGKLLNSHPFNKFHTPFSSNVEYSAGKMNGVWVISDRDKRIALQVELRDGIREGSMTVFHSNGQIYTQSHYKDGLLDGAVIEKNVDGKVTSEELYAAGRKIVTETEHFPNRHVKSVTQFMTSAAKATAPDDWSTTTLATYDNASGRQPHGTFVTYHDNGQTATKGTYEHGKLHGTYESWYRTGEVAATGQYEYGLQTGQWLWRHPNGMKKAVATYVAGKPAGETRGWDESGKALLR